MQQSWGHQRGASLLSEISRREAASAEPFSDQDEPEGSPRGRGRRRRPIQNFDSEPEISADSAAEGSDEEGFPRHARPGNARKKPVRRKRPRLVPPHSRTSRFRGVYWEPKGSKWYSSISSNHKQIHLGSFNTEEEAAQAFDQEAIRLRGANTFTNFPSTTYLANSADSDHDASAQPRRPPQAHRRKSVPKREADPLAPSFLEKDDSAATALLSLGSGIQPSAEAPVGPPRRIIAPPVTLRGQKRKRAGLAAKLRPKLDGAGRARSKFTGVYQQSRGSGWFASICVDKSMRYLGTFASEEEAARAFDQEAIRMRGLGIELNLPHEAEAFLKQLKEEEEEAEANGEAPRMRKGPRPLVSAGPDFEDRSTGLSLMTASRASSRSGDESKPSLRSELARPGDLARSSRRYKPSQKLRDYVSINREDSESLDDKSDTEPGEVPRGESYQARSLPVWRGKRLRSEPKHARPAGVEPVTQPPTQLIRPKAVVASGSSPAVRDFAASSGLNAAATPSSYLSLLAPALPTSAQPQQGPGAQRGFCRPAPSSSRAPALYEATSHREQFPSYHSHQHPSQQLLSPFLPKALQSKGFAAPPMPSSLGPVPASSSYNSSLPWGQGPYHLRPISMPQSLQSGTASFPPSTVPTSYSIYIRNPPTALRPGAWSLPGATAKAGLAQQPSMGSAFRHHTSDAGSDVRGSTPQGGGAQGGWETNALPGLHSSLGQSQQNYASYSQPSPIDHQGRPGASHWPALPLPVSQPPLLPLGQSWQLPASRQAQMLFNQLSQQALNQQIQPASNQAPEPLVAGAKYAGPAAQQPIGDPHHVGDRDASAFRSSGLGLTRAEPMCTQHNTLSAKTLEVPEKGQARLDATHEGASHIGHCASIAGQPDPRQSSEMSRESTPQQMPQRHSQSAAEVVEPGSQPGKEVKKESEAQPAGQNVSPPAEDLAGNQRGPALGTIGAGADLRAWKQPPTDQQAGLEAVALEASPMTPGSQREAAGQTAQQSPNLLQHGMACTPLHSNADEGWLDRAEAETVQTDGAQRANSFPILIQ